MTKEKRDKCTSIALSLAGLALVTFGLFWGGAIRFGIYASINTMGATAFVAWACIGWRE